MHQVRRRPRTDMTCKDRAATYVGVNLERENAKAKGQRSLKEEEVLRVKYDRGDRSHLDLEMYMGSVQQGGLW